MNAYRVSVAALLLSLLSACGEGSSRWAGVIVDSAGVAIVTNPDVGVWGPGQAWSLVEELRIGALEDPPELVFGSVGGIGVDSRGRIFILDDHDQNVRVFSPEGVFEYTVGGRGNGPGELQTAWGPLVGAGDTLLVPDGRLLRINRYAPDGSNAGDLRWEIEDGRTMAFKATEKGLIAEQIRPIWDPLGPPRDDEAMGDLIVLRGTNGALLDTLFAFPSGELMGPAGVRVFAPEPKWDLDADGRFLFGSSEEYRMELYADGRLERIITKPQVPKPVDDPEKAAIMGEMERRWGEGQLSDEMKARLRSRWSFAEVYPAYQDLAFGPGETIWVQKVKLATDLSDAELRVWQDVRSPDWEVFDSEGRFLGVVTMPERFTPLEFRGDHIYGVLLGEYDEPYVLKLGIARSSPPDAG